MPKNGSELLSYAKAGYDGDLCLTLAWSANWMAYEVGGWLRRTGRPMPWLVSMSRGYTMNVNDMKVALKKTPLGNAEVSRLA